MIPAEIEDAEAWEKSMRQHKDSTVEWLKRLNLTYDQLIEITASLKIEAMEISKINEELSNLVRESENFLMAMGDTNRGISNEAKLFLAKLHAETKSVVAESFFKGIEIYKKSNAKKSAKAKLNSDPKQAAKKEAKALWLEWQTGKTIHKNCAAFARHIISTLPIIESEETVKRWERAWRKEAKNKD